MAMRVTQDKVSNRVSNLRKTHEDRVSRQRGIIAMGRGIDPRTADYADISWNQASSIDNSNEVLRTNDPRTYLDIGIHLLSGRPLEWIMPRYSNIPDDEEEKHGQSERIVQSFFDINNKRLRNKQRPRFERSVCDSACRMGMVVIYMEKAKLRGETVFVMEPWDPTTVSERSDDEGLAEISRDYTGSLWDLLGVAQREQKLTETGDNTLIGWDTQSIVELIEEGEDEIELTEYYIREDGEVYHSVMRRKGDPLKYLTPMNRLDIPVMVTSVNGEAFPGEQFWRSAQSILEPNFDQYILQHENLKRIEQHRDRTLAWKVQENTQTGRGGSVDPAVLAKNDEVTVFPFRLNEGFDIKQPPQFDQSMAILGSEYPGQIQRGGVPYIFTGAIETNLSGFAIFQLLNAAMAAVSEAKLVLQSIYADLGQWILEELKNDKAGGKMKILTTSGIKRESFEVEEITFNNIPDITMIQNRINLAQPSDLIERMNIAKIASPGSGPLLTLKTIFNELLPDIVPDASGEARALKDERILQLPVIQMLDARASLIELKSEFQRRGDLVGAQGIQGQIDQLEQSMSGNQSGEQSGQSTSSGTNATADNRVNPNQTDRAIR